MAIDNIEDASYELDVAIEETQYDMGDDAPDEGSMAADLFASMAWNWKPEIAAELARREFGFVPAGSPQAVVDAFKRLHPHGLEF